VGGHLGAGARGESAPPPGTEGEWEEECGGGNEAGNGGFVSALFPRCFLARLPFFPASRTLGFPLAFFRSTLPDQKAGAREERVPRTSPFKKKPFYCWWAPGPFTPVAVVADRTPRAAPATTSRSQDSQVASKPNHSRAGPGVRICLARFSGEKGQIVCSQFIFSIIVF
jgi:hypothetical protein